MDRFRFDDNYEKIYEYENGAYVFIGSYFSYGITKKMKDAKKIKIIEEEKQ